MDEPESPEIFFSEALFGPLSNDEEIARSFATLILRGLYGDAELTKQQPRRVDDQGGVRLISGSWQEQGKPAGTGAWFIRVRKSAARSKNLPTVSR